MCAHMECVVRSNIHEETRPKVRRVSIVAPRAKHVRNNQRKGPTENVVDGFATDCWSEVLAHPGAPDPVRRYIISINHSCILHPCVRPFPSVLSIAVVVRSNNNVRRSRIVRAFATQPISKSGCSRWVSCCAPVRHAGSACAAASHPSTVMPEPKRCVVPECPERVPRAVLLPSAPPAAGPKKVSGPATVA
jgi:hypothetical protein